MKKKIHKTHESAHFRFSVSAYGLKAQTQYFHMMHLWLFITGEAGEEESSLFCYPSRNTVNCLHSQRQLGSFGLDAHIVQAAFVLTSPEGLLKKYFKYSCFFMSPSHPLEKSFKSYDWSNLGSNSATALQQGDLFSFNFMVLYIGPFSHFYVICSSLRSQSLICFLKCFINWILCTQLKVFLSSHKQSKV